MPAWSHEQGSMPPCISATCDLMEGLWWTQAKHTLATSFSIKLLSNTSQITETSPGILCRLGTQCLVAKEHVFPLRGFTGFGLFCRLPYRRTRSQCDAHGQGPPCPGPVMHTFCPLAKPKPHGRKDLNDEVGEIISLFFSTHLFNVCQGANLLLLHFTTKLNCLPNWPIEDK